MAQLEVMLQEVLAEEALLEQNVKMRHPLDRNHNHNLSK